MFQLGFAFEGQFMLKTLTLAVGWGLGMFANQPWWKSLFAIINQGQPGARRWGLLFGGFFFTVQAVDIIKAQNAVAEEALARKRVPVVRRPVGK